MNSGIFIVVLLGLIGGTFGANLDELINQVFNQNQTGSETVSPRQPSVTNSPVTPDLTPNKNGNGPLPGIDECVCVPYYQCNNGTVNKNGEGLIDIREKDGPCEDYLEQCCGKDQKTEEPILPTPKPNKQTGCGYLNPDGVGFRITGDKDNEAQFGEFPWMVAILHEETVEGNPQKLNVYQCGGALIHPQVVVTAAHCVKGKTGFKIRAGEWDTQTKNEIYPHQDREVASIIIHPQFYAGASFNDIALLFLQSPVDLAENVNIICLPPQGLVENQALCLASGWGKDVFGKEGKYQVILKKIDLPIVPRQQCQDALRTTRLGKYFELHRSFICAGGQPGKDTCKGDGGSPLVCPTNKNANQYYQAGIVAWGIGCGENKIPGVYVDVALFRSWIDEQLLARNLDTQGYNY